MRTRARALALRRRPDPLPWLVLWLLLGLLCAALAGTAHAQQQGTPPASNTPTIPPGAGSDPSAPAPAPRVLPETPSGNPRNGVAVPRPNQDAGIVAPTPAAPSDMPVIRPPGTPGGNPNVVPK